MALFQILTFSPKTSFLRKIKDFLSSSPGFQLKNIPSLPGEIPSDIGKEDWIGIVDLDNQSKTPDVIVNIIQDHYPEKQFLLLSKELNLLPSSSTAGLHLIDIDALSSSLFLPFLTSLAEKSALLSANLQVETDLNKRLSELLLIRKASLHLTMNLSLDSVLESILESAMELVSAEDTHVFLYEHGVLSFASALFKGHQQREPFMKPRPQGLTYKVAREGNKIVVNDMKANPLFDDSPWEGSIIGLPLKIGNTVLGVMNVALTKAYEFSENEIRTLEFLADQASIAIQNAKLYEQAQQEISVRKKAEKALKHLAHHDALTGLPNRRLFNERITLEISRSQRNNQKIGVMLFDLDHLKEVNDSFGHSLGDLLLQAVAQRLLGLLRKSDTVARMGGDEFLLILPEMKQSKDAVLTAERILSALSTPFLLEGNQINITTSIGIVFFPDDGTEVDDLIKKADIAMYKAKEKGGNIYHFYTD
jgi:diguanylate cyclase (GGDEF)-like protein